MRNSNLLNRLGVAVGEFSFTRREYRLLLYLVVFIGLMVLGVGLRLLQGEVLCDVDDRFFRPEYFLYYLLWSVFLLLIFLEAFQFPIKCYRIVILFLFYKLPLAFCMLYLLMGRYSTGDVNIYFWRLFNEGGVKYAKEITFIINKSLFSCMPVSLVGLSVIMAVVGLIAYLLLIKFFWKMTLSRFQLVCVLLLIPSVGLQCGFIGREGYNLLAISFFYYSLYKFTSLKDHYLWLLAAVFFVGIIYWFRSYLGLMVIFSFCFCLLTKRLSIRLVGLSLLILFMLLSIPLVASHFGAFVNPGLFKGGLSSGLQGAYAGGSQMLDPWPGPLKMLQVFRPFPWEAGNFLAFFASWENVVILAFLIYRLAFIKKSILWCFSNNLAVRVVFVFSILYWIVFSFSSNVGDLSRRRLYFVPMLLVLMLEARKVVMFPEKMHNKDDIVKQDSDRF